jgi:hypothetical protein
MEETLQPVRHRRRHRGRARDDTKGASAAATPSASSIEELVAWGEPARDARGRARRAGPRAELLTVIEGDGAPLAGEAVAALAPDTAEVELSRGGQPSWWWLVSR